MAGNALSLASAALLALALAVGANSGIFSLSQLMRRTMPEGRSVESTRSFDGALQSLDPGFRKATGHDLLNRRAFTGRF